MIEKKAVPLQKQQKKLTARQLTIGGIVFIFLLMGMNVWFGIEMAQGLKNALFKIIDMHVHHPGAFDSLHGLVGAYLYLLPYVCMPALVVFVSVSVLVHIIKHKNANGLPALTVFAPLLFMIVVLLLTTAMQSI